MSLPNTLADWLTLLEQRHPKEIDMGLARVRAVHARMGTSFSCPVILVAGTNGKGSTCAMLESLFLQAGYRVGLYSKPHFLDFNERVRVQGLSVEDAILLEAFARVETARTASPEPVSLTYFEFTTLAICDLLAQQALDVAILEVGLGGRLDAVNVYDADVAIVTSIDIDHVDYLGCTRETIGLEKAGIFRKGRTAICADPRPPASLIEHATEIGADLWLFGRDFNYTGDKQQWNFIGRTGRRNALGYPSLRGANQLLNASAALAALEALRLQLPVGAQEVRNGLLLVDLPGRFQVVPGQPALVLDVAHNPHAAAALAQNLDNMGFYPRTLAVFGAMHDKDISGIIDRMGARIDAWHVCTLPGPRAAQAEVLCDHVRNTFTASHTPDLHAHATPEAALRVALAAAGEGDRIVVFGSFLTVAGAMRVLRDTGRAGRPNT